MAVPAVNPRFTPEADDQSAHRVRIMGWDKADIFALADSRLAWLEQRQKVLADNIANANTPGRRPKDLQPFAATLAKAGSGQMDRTDPRHLAGRHGAGSWATHAVTSGAIAPDGNAIELDVELGRVADTENAQEMVSALYKKYLGLFRIALGRSS
jgi:flagellar basal-body rod protein FlgB